MSAVRSMRSRSTPGTTEKKSMRRAIPETYRPRSRRGNQVRVVDVVGVAGLESSERDVHDARPVVHEVGAAVERLVAGDRWRERRDDVGGAAGDRAGRAVPDVEVVLAVG